MQIYRLRPYVGLLKRSWSGETVVYLSDARETHLLTEPCAYVLDVLERGPTSFEVLRDELQILLDGAQDQEVLELLGQIVDTLGKIGLIEAREDLS